MGSLPSAPPEERVLDTSDVFSRAARAEVSRQLEALAAERVEAHLVTVGHLDYDVTLQKLGDQLLDRWQRAGADDNQLLFLIDTQTNSAAVLSSPGLQGQLSSDLLRSTARSTMAQPIRDGSRFRQASLDGIARLQIVLQGGDDPGEFSEPVAETLPTNVPTKEETAESNAFTWVVVLLVVGTVVPMATWWVFSR